MDTITTTDLSDFGFRELEMASELLKAYCNSPPEFLGDGVQVMMNRQSGNVFLTDEEYNVAMLNGDQLEAWLFTPYEGHEGFLSDLLEEYSPSDLNSEDKAYLRDWAERLSVQLSESWLLEEA